MPHLSRTAAAVVTVAAAAAVLAASLTADAARSGHPVAAPPAKPTRANQIQNVDQVKTAIKGYYGDTADPRTVDPVTGKRDLRTFAANGSYAREVKRTTAMARSYLAKAHAPKGKRKAIVLDVDDTSLVTYNYEIFTNFVYDPATNAKFVNAGSFPAVPSMPQLAKYATAHGYTLFFLTGRGETQRSGTAANLAKVGYPRVPASRLFLKDLTKSIYRSCYRPAQDKTCTTVQYKSLTRKYIESGGYDIVANFGDQYSDLRGGYANRRYKLPNPMYYLP